MTTKASFDAAANLVLRCGRACRAYGSDVVIGGRMALYLYRHHPQLSGGASPMLATREVDVVVPRRLPTRTKPIVEALADEALVPYDTPGLDRRRRGKRIFQDAKHGTERPAPEFVEFAAPRVTEVDPMLEPQPDLVASPLRYVELLLFEPLSVIADGVTLHVAAPSMFIAQKVLMRESKSGRKQDKDLVSVYEAFRVSQPRWREERELLARASSHDATWSKWLRSIPTLLTKLFATPTSSGCVAVEAALSAKIAPAAAVSLVVRSGVEEMFNQSKPTSA